jgi:hypothetical protein
MRVRDCERRSHLLRAGTQQYDHIEYQQDTNPPTRSAGTELLNFSDRGRGLILMGVRQYDNTELTTGTAHQAQTEKPYLSNYVDFYQTRWTCFLEVDVPDPGCLFKLNQCLRASAQCVIVIHV